MNLEETCLVDVDWIYLAQDKDEISNTNSCCHCDRQLWDKKPYWLPYRGIFL